MYLFIPTATNGVVFAPRPGIDRVALVPSFVKRPVVSYNEVGETLLIIYPVADESVSADADAPPLRLVRLSKALGDEKRLRILRALADGEKHGYGFMQETAAHTGGMLRLGPGTLYGSIKRLLEDRLIEESDERPDPAHDDERRRYYRLTELGQRVAAAEAARLEELVRLAHSRRLLPGSFFPRETE